MENKKQKIIVGFGIVLLGLAIGIYQYVKEFQVELTSAAYTTSKPANGHSWSEMECTSGLCVTENNNVGIGTDNPTEKLQVSGNAKISGTLGVDGKIVMESETAASDTSNTVVTKGYLSSYATPILKVIAGNNATCLAGTDTIMRCSGNPCTWYDADYSLSSWSKIMCGERLTSDGSPLLVYNQHTSTQCTTAGGSVVVGDSMRMCRFNNSSCPSGWTSYSVWRTVPEQTSSCSFSCRASYRDSVTCYGSCTGTIPASGWSNSIGTPGSCGAYVTCTHKLSTYGCSGSCGVGYGTPNQVGCY